MQNCMKIIWLSIVRERLRSLCVEEIEKLFFFEREDDYGQWEGILNTFEACKTILFIQFLICDLMYYLPVVNILIYVIILLECLCVYYFSSKGSEYFRARL